MDVPTTFAPLLQVFAAEMTRPTFRVFSQLVAGWLLAPRRTITGMLRAAGIERHHSAYHRLFAAAEWSIDNVGLALFDLITKNMETVFLVGDDTLLSRSGLKVFGAGMHRDAVLSSRSFAITRWGHCWVVLGVAFESRHVPGKQFVLPVLARLDFNKSSVFNKSNTEKWNRKYRKKSDLMIEMLQQLDDHCRDSEKTLHFIGDSAFTSPSALARIPDSIEVTGRVVANVRMCEPPPEPPPERTGKRGRLAVRGGVLPKPEELLRAKGLRRITINLYADSTYHVRVAEQRGRFYKAPRRDVKVVAIEHLTGGRGTEVFYTTAIETAIETEAGVEVEAETVLETFSKRWPIEVTFHDVKQHLGIDEPQNRVTKAVRRTAPAGFLHRVNRALRSTA